jgi:hypothetical protein
MNKIGIILLFFIVGCSSTGSSGYASSEAIQVFKLSTRMGCAQKNPESPKYCDCFVNTMNAVTPPRVKQLVISDINNYQKELLTVMFDNRDSLRFCDQYKNEE